MAEWVLKYADARGEVRENVAVAATEHEARERYSSQGFLVYSVRERGGSFGPAMGRKSQKLNLGKFLIFNQQFVTLVRAGLPILKSLDLLSERLTEPKLARHLRAVRDDVKNGEMLSDAFRNRGVFPPIYVTSVLAGEKSGSLAEVLDRYISYQKLSQAVKKKLLVSLIYPSLLMSMTLLLIVFLITYVVPNFAQLYTSMNAKLPVMTQVLIAFGTTARAYVVVGVGGLVGAIVLFRLWARGDAARMHIDRFKLRTPVLGDIWIKYQVAQFSRVLGTLLVGGIPLVQALDTAAKSLGTPLLRDALENAQRTVKEGQPLSSSLAATRIFPGLAIDMIEVGESTG
ncbi:MAG: type II secretion system F family protein, partial [Bryobacteraceae bacterium]